MTSTDPDITKLLVAISTLCKVLGLALAAHGLGASPTAFWLQVIGGSVMIVGPAIWDVWLAISNIRLKRLARAEGVQAGINLTVAGKALAADGKSVVSILDGTTPPLPVTLATADQIVKDFPPTSPIAKE